MSEAQHGGNSDVKGSIIVEDITIIRPRRDGARGVSGETEPAEVKGWSVGQRFSTAKAPIALTRLAFGRRKSILLLFPKDRPTGVKVQATSILVAFMTRFRARSLATEFDSS